jgi:hypothetical protein
VVNHLAPAIHSPHVAAFAASLRPVFSAFGLIAAVAFALTLLLREIPLRRISLADVTASDSTSVVADRRAGLRRDENGPASNPSRSTASMERRMMSR